MGGLYDENILGVTDLGIQNSAYRDFFYSLPEEVQEQVNAHQDEFHSFEDMRRYVEELTRRA